MDIKSEVALKVTAALSAAEVIAAMRELPAFQSYLQDVARLEAIKDPSGLTLLSSNLTIADDGTAKVEIVYQKNDQPSAPDAGQRSPEGQQRAVQDDATPPVVPLSLTPLGLTPAAA